MCRIESFVCSWLRVRFGLFVYVFFGKFDARGHAKTSKKDLNNDLESVEKEFRAALASKISSCQADMTIAPTRSAGIPTNPEGRRTPEDDEPERLRNPEGDKTRKTTNPGIRPTPESGKPRKTTNPGRRRARKTRNPGRRRAHRDPQLLTKLRRCPPSPAGAHRPPEGAHRQPVIRVDHQYRQWIKQMKTGYEVPPSGSAHPLVASKAPVSTL